MSDTTNDTTNTGLSGLISAGESIYTAITGKSSANVEKVTSGLSSVADGALPFIESKVSFDLGKVIMGATAICTGVALVLTGMKKKVSTSDAATAPTSNSTSAVSPSSGMN